MKRNLLTGKKLVIFLSFLFAGQLFSQTLLDPVHHPKFVNPLPIPEILQPEIGSSNDYKLIISEFSQNLGLVDAAGNPLETIVWGYNGSYPGPTIEARTNHPIKVQWVNQLPKEHLFAIDKTIHWAGTDYNNSNSSDNDTEVVFNGIPTVTHLHGGHTDADSDGHPEAWYTPDFLYTGSNFFNNFGKFTYDNSQEAATLWYHDHTIGITRLNVYAGLAGFYILRDDHEDELNLPKNEHVDINDQNSPMEYFEIPIAIQDRIFDSYGQLVYPTETFFDPDESSVVIENSILPEVFGDFILVNGKPWPVLEVQPRKYRLRFLNGSDSRFYDLFLPGITFIQIGSDGGLLEAPVSRDRLLLGPGERLDVIVDFSAPGLWGKSLILKNNARSPFPFGKTVNPLSSGQIMAFNVVTPLTNPDTSVIPTSLRTTTTAVPGKILSETRKLVLFEEEDEHGRLLPSLGTVEKGPLGFMDEITENPGNGDTEIWEIYNTTPDAHPIHLHLVHFQVISTQKFNLKKSLFGAGAQSAAQLIGQPKPPAPENAGRKDTFIVYPGEVARVKAYFDKEGEYVWHCHILSHEDNDMMRPFYVGTLPEVESVSMKITRLSPENLESLIIAPNPVRDETQILFKMKSDSQVLLEVFDLSGSLITTSFKGIAKANQDYNVIFERSGLPTGTYVCKLSTPDGRSFEKYIMIN